MIKLSPANTHVTKHDWYMSSLMRRRYALVVDDIESKNYDTIFAIFATWEAADAYLKFMNKDDYLKMRIMQVESL